MTKGLLGRIFDTLTPPVTALWVLALHPQRVDSSRDSRSQVFLGIQRPSLANNATGQQRECITRRTQQTTAKRVVLSLTGPVVWFAGPKGEGGLDDATGQGGSGGGANYKQTVQTDLGNIERESWGMENMAKGMDKLKNMLNLKNLIGAKK